MSEKKFCPPNIFLIISHDTGINFHSYGYPTPTPNIDAIGKKGVVFKNNFCTAPQCTPSRGSILTGKHPHVNGLMGLTNFGWNLPEKNLTIPQILKANGYSTHLLGVQHSHRDAKQLGYDNISPRKDFPHYASTVRRRVKKFIKSLEAGEIRQPFFCNIGLFETHRPFSSKRLENSPNEQANKWEDRDKGIDYNFDFFYPYLPNEPEMYEEISRFNLELQKLDVEVGKILDMINHAEIAQNSIIIFTVDHGWAFPRAKGTLYDPGLRTALLIMWPNHIPAGKVYDQLISNVDLLPTLMDLARISLESQLKEKIQGKSFASLLTSSKNQEYQERTEIFAEMTFHDQGYNPIRAIRTKQWKYIRNFSNFKDCQFQIPTDILEEAPAGKLYIDHHPEYNTPRLKEELYNLFKDPWETANLANNPQYTTILDDLRRKLMKFLKESKDPILDRKPVEPKVPEFFSF